jgi:hypothetical protein
MPGGLAGQPGGVAAVRQGRPGALHGADGAVRQAQAGRGQDARGRQRTALPGGKVQALVKKAYQTSSTARQSGFSLSLPRPGTAPGRFRTRRRWRSCARRRCRSRPSTRPRCSGTCTTARRSPDVLRVHKSRDWSPRKVAPVRVSPGHAGVLRPVAVVQLPAQLLRRRTGVATPLAIRHVLMSTKSAQPVPGERTSRASWRSASREQMKLDDRTRRVHVGRASTR